MKKIYCIGLLFLVLAGCKSKIPGNIIQPDQMAAVLYDIHVTDGYISSMPLQDSAKKVGAAYYKGVYTKFGIDSAKYTSSMNYYYANPDLLSSIYEKVTGSLKKSKDSLEKINEKILKLEAAKRAKVVKKTKDSLDKIHAKMSPLDIKKAKADSLKKVKTDSLIKVKAIRKTKDSLAKVNAKILNPAIKKAKADSLKKVFRTKRLSGANKFKGGKTTVEVN